MIRTEHCEERQQSDLLIHGTVLYRTVSSGIDTTWNSTCLSDKAECSVEFEEACCAFVILHRGMD
jgi:hypothetical protein